MIEWLKSNWQFVVGDILVPITTFVIGLFVGKSVEKKSNKSNKSNKSVIKGNNNTVNQNTELEK